MAIIINVQAVTEGINNALNYIESQESALDQVNNYINSMDDIWDAGDQKIYSRQFQSTKTKIKTFNQGVKNSLNTMKKFVNDCVELDLKTGRDLRNISW